MWDILSSHEKYASKFDGIDSVLEIRHTDKQAEPTWEKPLVLLSHMDDGYDYLMWVDDDAGFIRFDEDFRDKLPTDGKRFYFTQEREWFEGEVEGFVAEDVFLNAGVFLVKCCEENKAVLKEWYSRRGKRQRNGLNDQPVIVKWYLENKDICGLLDPVVFNAFPMHPKHLAVGTTNDCNDTTFIVHFITYMKRDRALREKFFPQSKLVPPPPKPWTSVGADDWDD